MLALGGSVPIAAYLGRSNVSNYGLAIGKAYADQNERDYAAMRAAVDSGRDRHLMVKSWVRSSSLR
jgi:hypothetical protein